jgi:hypothetical protein
LATLTRCLIGEIEPREWVATLNVDEARVFRAIGVPDWEDVGLKHLEVLTGLRTAMKDGDVTADEAFPEIVKTASSGDEILGKGKKPAKQKAGEKSAESKETEDHRANLLGKINEHGYKETSFESWMRANDMIDKLATLQNIKQEDAAKILESWNTITEDYERDSTES